MASDRGIGSFFKSVFFGPAQDPDLLRRAPDSTARNATYDVLFKILLLGDTGVGKSCVFKRITQNAYGGQDFMTVGVDFGVHEIQIDGKTIKLQIWDAGGHVRFRETITKYYSGADGALIIYDTSNCETFKSVESRWLKDVQDKNIARIGLVGNKSDLEERRQVSTAEAKEYADRNGFFFIETSAKDSTNIEEAFRNLVTDIYTRPHQIKAARQKLSHTLAAEQGDAAVDHVRQLLTEFPEVALMTDGEDKALPLHQALRWQQGSGALAIVQALLKAAPQTMEKANLHGWFPLHVAAASQVGDSNAAVVETLLKVAAPKAAMAAENDGWLPLHVAAKYQVGAKGTSVVEALLKAAPAAAIAATKSGCLPLHVAAHFQRGASGAAVVGLLLNAAPQAAVMVDKSGSIPLHYAAHSQGGAKGTHVVEALLKAAPQAALTGEGDGWLPLHVAACHQGGKKGTCVVEVLLRAAPQAAMTATKAGSLPLHMAARYQGGEKGTAVVEMLLNAAPQATMMATKDGFLPLHIAARYQGGEMGTASVGMLLSAAPQAIMMATKDGSLPLHIAARYQGGEKGTAVVEMLLNAAPQAAMMATTEGFLPLHIAARNQSGEADAVVVEMLLKIAPQAAQVASADGRFPLHLAAQCTGGELGTAAVEKLLTAAPQAAMTADKVGWLPLHHAARHQRGENGAAIVNVLIRAAPEAAMMPTNDSGLLPAHVAAAYQSGQDGADVLCALLNAVPQAAMTGQNDGWLPLHVAAQHQSGDKGVAVVTTLLNAAPQAALVAAKDGKLPLHITAEFQGGEKGAEVARLLLTTAPEALQERAFKRTPLAIAMSRLPKADPMVILLHDYEQMLRALPALSNAEIERHKILEATGLYKLANSALLESLSLPICALSQSPFQSIFESCAAAVSVCEALRASNPATIRALAATFETLAQQGLAAVHVVQLANAVAAAVDASRLCVLENPANQCKFYDDVLPFQQAAEQAALALAQQQAVLLATVTADEVTNMPTADARHTAFEQLVAAVGSLSVAMEAADITRWQERITGHLQTTIAVHQALCVVLGAETVAALEALPLDETGLDQSIEACLCQLNEVEALLPVTLAALFEQEEAATLAWPSMLKSLPDCRTAAQQMLALVDTVQWLACRGRFGTFEPGLVRKVPWHMLLHKLCELPDECQRLVDDISTAIRLRNSLQDKINRTRAQQAARDVLVKDLDAAAAMCDEAKAEILAAKSQTQRAKRGSAEEKVAAEAALQAARQSHAAAAKELDRAVQDVLTAAYDSLPELLLEHRDLLRSATLVRLSHRARDEYAEGEPLAAGRSTVTKTQYVQSGAVCVLKSFEVQGAMLDPACRREALMLQRLDHPHVIKLEALFIDGRTAYLHLPYYPHGDLDQWLAQSLTAPVDAVCRFSAQLCDALVYLAEQGVVHCDIKPQNILIDDDAASPTKLKAVLADFDVSKSVASPAGTVALTRVLLGGTTGVVTHGTVGYAAPEVVHADRLSPAPARHSVDVFSLGCVIYRMHFYPRMLAAPPSAKTNVADDPSAWDLAQKPPVAHEDWTQADHVRDMVRAACMADPLRRPTAARLLYHPYLDASRSITHYASSLPLYWQRCSESSCNLVQEPSLVEGFQKLMNDTAAPETHGMHGHAEKFAKFKVVAVHRVECAPLWRQYAAKRHTLKHKFSASKNIPLQVPLKTMTSASASVVTSQVFLDGDAGEVLLFHGTDQIDSVVHNGFNIRFSFEGGNGALFGRGFYFADSASKADMYVGPPRASMKTYRMLVSRVLLGRWKMITTARQSEALFPTVPAEELDSSERDVLKRDARVRIFYDTLVTDPAKISTWPLPAVCRSLREIVLHESVQAYPEFIVEYERV